jgi:hypothetical protein
MTHTGLQAEYAEGLLARQVRLAEALVLGELLLLVAFCCLIVGRWHTLLQFILAPRPLASAAYADHDMLSPCCNAVLLATVQAMPLTTEDRSDALTYPTAASGCSQPLCLPLAALCRRRR